MKGNDLERRKGPRWLNVSEIHQDQIIPKFLVAFNPFVVVQEIAAAIDNEPTAVNLDGLRMMRRMPMDDRDIGFVDQRVRKTALLFWNIVAPVRPPMDRNNDQITRPIKTHDGISDP